MKATFQKFPAPIQNQIIVRGGLCALSLAAGIGLLVLLGDPTLLLPFVLAAGLMAVSAGHIYHIAAEQRYLVLVGTVLKVERTEFWHRPKALLLEVEGKALRLVLHSRHRAPAAGASVSIYAPDAATLYEWRGMRQLFSYLALVVEKLPS